MSHRRPAQVIPLRPHRAAPPPPTPEELRSLERAVRRAAANVRSARTQSAYDIAVVQYRALREELAQVRGQSTIGGAS